MAKKNELRDLLINIRNEKKSGKIYIYTEGIGSKKPLTMLINNGQIVDILDIEEKKIYECHIKSIAFVQQNFPEITNLDSASYDISNIIDMFQRIDSSTKISKKIKNTDLWELSNKIDEIINKKQLDRVAMRGQIGIRAGVLMNIDKHTSYDQNKIEKIKLAAEKILGEKL